MPPKRAPKRGAAPKAVPPLSGCQIAVSGTFPGMTQAAVKSLIQDLGAAPVGAVGPATSHLITTQADFDKASTKVVAAEKHGAHAVGLGWLQACLSTNSRVQEAPHVFDTSSTPDSTTKSTTRSSVKREASPPQTDGPDDDDEPKPKRAKANGKAKKKAVTAEQEGSEAATEPQSSEIKVPVDECCPLLSYGVYIDADGAIWDASLNQSHSSNNNNKFYRVQVSFESCYKVDVSLASERSL